MITSSISISILSLAAVIALYFAYKTALNALVPKRIYLRPDLSVRSRNLPYS